jgi:hypothetical protein
LPLQTSLTLFSTPVIFSSIKIHEYLTVRSSGLADGVVIKNETQVQNRFNVSKRRPRGLLRVNERYTALDRLDRIAWGWPKEGSSIDEITDAHLFKNG